MNILVAYDGSECSEEALTELGRAGLPQTGKATLISVAEVWLPPQNGSNGSVRLDHDSEELIRKHHERGKKAVLEAEALAHDAQNHLKKILPDWTITAEATYGSPAWEILSKADIINPDLIVVGSHGRSAIGRLFLGSVSQKVLNEARCSVRISRLKEVSAEAPIRVLIGFDGSKGAQFAVESVAQRNWPKNTEIRVLVATDPVVPTAIGRFVSPVVNWAETEMRIEREWITKIASSAIETLSATGLSSDIAIELGAAKTVLVDEANSWNADMIFVGANAFGSRTERFLLGSTSSAVASRASCSVEVVRKAILKEQAMPLDA